MAPTLALHRAIDHLPRAALALFADPREDLFASRLWYETLAQSGLAAGIRPAFALCSANKTPFGVLPLAQGPRERDLASLTGPYTCGFHPLLSSSARAFEMGLLVGRFCRRASLVRLDAIEPETPGLEGFISGLRRAGLSVWPFECFGNWYEPVSGRSFAAYLAARPGALKATIKRKRRRMAGQARLSVITGGAELETAIAAYEEVYRRSWKEPEPFPRFNPDLMRATGAAGLLRLGVLALSGRIVALQFWIISGGRAMVVKLAHDEAFAQFSPGTVLTALMIERLLERERLSELDFGRGDDPYKRLWTSERRRRIGLLLANPWRVRGIAEIARCLGGAGRRRLRAVLRPRPSVG